MTDSVNDSVRAHMVSGDGHYHPASRRPSMIPETSMPLDSTHALHSNIDVHARTLHVPVSVRAHYNNVRAQYSDRTSRRESSMHRQHGMNGTRHARPDGAPNGSSGTYFNESTRQQPHDIYHERTVSEPEVPPRSARSTFRSIRSASSRGDEYQFKSDSYVVPALPMPIAVVCCILNFLVPGFGSICASVCVFCCARTDDMTGREKLGSCCTVFGIGLLQLLLVACFLIGWIWSCIWGVTFIGMSANYYHEDDADDDDPEYASTNNPVYRRAAVSRLPTPQVVVDQPYPGVSYAEAQRQYRRRLDAQRRSTSRIRLTSSNLIYPMRAPSNIAYNSPPPPYQASATIHERAPDHHNNASNGGSRHHGNGRDPHRHRQSHVDNIQEERHR
ncbi:hypothetical protein DPMN_121864 [Dreissena polymorpha]|uniref:Protein SPEC3 n=1 Tax=Dreissena polymorpha TaxID=45954 RepID=A0A9D4GNA3_DREPO|nr:hypothetical protein DPMN_121864 [Dreissena polymorpha]